jgi:membrane protein
MWPLAGYAALAAVAFARRGSYAARRAWRRPDARAPLAQDETPAPPAQTQDSSWWGMTKAAGMQWVGHKDARLGAALSYYSVFSLGPIIVIAIAVAGLLFGNDMVRSEVIGGLRGMLGDSGTQAVETMLASANKPREGLVATVIGIATLVFAALGVVVQLKDAFNTVWEVTSPPGKGIWGFVRTYVLSLAGVLGVGFLLLISMLVTTALSAVGKFLAPYLPEAALQAVSFVVSFGVITLLFAMMFKWLPDAKVAWRDVWIGAIATAALFEIGKFLIGLYIGKQGLESTYGAAASIVVVLVWVYYSAQIVLFGGEFTNVYAKARGSLRGGRDPQAYA